MLFAVQILCFLLALEMFAGGLLNMRQAARDRRDVRRALRSGTSNTLPCVSVCVPARNEAANISECVASLARQNYPGLEVFVLDDCSDDGTGDIARLAARGAANVRVMDGTPLPPGWIGKSHACSLMAGQASGEWILFTDADTVFAPDAVREAVALAQLRGADMLTGFPRLLAIGVWEQLAVPILTALGTGVSIWSFVNNPRFRKNGIASGAFMLFRRETYEAIGGHAGVRASIVEDLALAQKVKRMGRRLYAADGSRWVDCRMYRGFGEVWEGFTKNSHAGGGNVGLCLGMLYMLGMFVLPIVVIAAARGEEPGLSMTLLPLLQVVLVYGWRAIGDRLYGTPSLRSLLLAPFAAIFWCAIMFESLRRSLRGVKTPWRGREYDLSETPPAASDAFHRGN